MKIISKHRLDGGTWDVWGELDDGSTLLMTIKTPDGEKPDDLAMRTMATMPVKVRAEVVAENGTVISGKHYGQQTPVAIIDLKPKNKVEKIDLKAGTEKVVAMMDKLAPEFAGMIESDREKLIQNCPNLRDVLNAVKKLGVA